MNSTPKSLLTDSSRHSEAKGSSESSFAVSELRAPRIMPLVIVQGSSVKPHLVETKAETKAKTNSAAPSTQHEASQPTPGDTKSTGDTNTVPSKVGSVTFMRPRYSRRVQSRSEPVSNSPATESADRNLPPAKPTDNVPVCISDGFTDGIASRLSHLTGATSCIRPDFPGHQQRHRQRHRQPGAISDSQAWQQRPARCEATADSSAQL